MSAGIALLWYTATYQAMQLITLPSISSCLNIAFDIALGAKGDSKAIEKRPMSVGSEAVAYKAVSESNN